MVDVFEPTISTMVKEDSYPGGTRRFKTPGKQSNSSAIANVGKGLSSKGFNGLNLISHGREPEYMVHLQKAKVKFGAESSTNKRPTNMSLDNKRISIISQFNEIDRSPKFHLEYSQGLSKNPLGLYTRKSGEFVSHSAAKQVQKNMQRTNISVGIKWNHTVRRVKTIFLKCLILNENKTTLNLNLKLNFIWFNYKRVKRALSPI